MLRQGRKFLHGFAFRCFFLPLLLAGPGLAIERLGHRSWAAHLAQLQNFDVKLATLVPNAQHVSDANIPRRLGFDFIGSNAADVASFGSLGPRLEEARSPEPLVHANSIHDVCFSNRDTEK